MMTNMDIANDREAADVTTIPPPEKKRKGRGKTTGLSTQKKRKKNENEKLKVIIPPDRTVVVGPGAKDFITELSVKVLHNARHDVKNWKKVPDHAKNNIVAYMLDGLPSSIINIITNSTSSNETSSTRLMNGNWVTLTKKQNVEMRLSKLNSQDLKKKIPKELVEANNQVFEKIHEQLKAHSMLTTAKETKSRLLYEKSSLETNYRIEKEEIK